VRNSRPYISMWMLLLTLLGWSLIPAAQSHPVRAQALTPTTPMPVVVQMTDSSLNKNALVEAIQEIDLSMAGALYPGCIGHVKRPTVNLRTDDIELTGIATIVTCGWKPDETVTVTLMDPQGDLFTKTYQAAPSKYVSDIYEVDLLFQPGVDAPEGKYRFTFQGSDTLKVNVFFQKPKAPRLYVVSDDRFQPQLGAFGGKHKLRLEGFLPNEPVRLLAYRFEGTVARFYGVQDMTTDRLGQLIVEANFTDIPDESEMNYFAYGLETHFVPLERFSADGFSKTRLFDMDLYCPGALTPQFNQPQEIQAVDPTAKLDIHYQPGFGSRITAQVAGSTTMRAYGYPKCIDHAYWWKVYIANPFLYGWVPESFLGKYVVEAKK